MLIAARLERPWTPSRRFDLESSRGLAPCRGVRREPDIGQQFIDLICGMGRQATEDIPEVREAIDVEVLAVAVEESRTAAVRQPRSRPLS